MSFENVIIEQVIQKINTSQKFDSLIGLLN